MAANLQAFVLYSIFVVSVEVQVLPWAPFHKPAPANASQRKPLFYINFYSHTMPVCAGWRWPVLATFQHIFNTFSTHFQPIFSLKICLIFKQQYAEALNLHGTSTGKKPQCFSVLCLPHKVYCGIKLFGRYINS